MQYYAIEAKEEKTLRFIADDNTIKCLPQRDFPSATVGDVFLETPHGLVFDAQETAKRKTTAQELLARLLKKQ